MSNLKQIKQISNFLSAYPKDIVDIGIEAWRTGIIPEITEGRVSEIPLAQNYNELTEETKQFFKEESESLKEIMPFCNCGKQLNLTGVCSGCVKGKEGFKSKLFCHCGQEIFYKETVQEILNNLKEDKYGIQ